MADSGRTKVTLRIEGKTRTIYEGPVSTCGHRVTMPSGGTHHCDGTNNDVNPCTGPTCTTALDDGNKIANFGFDGIYDESKDDFDITTIGEESSTGRYFWARCVNFIPTNFLGCQELVWEGDEVLFAYATANVTRHYLKLTGPKIAVLMKPVVLVVTDGGTDSPIKGAIVNGQRSDDQGRVTITFRRVGTQKLKAEREPDSIRSNELNILVIVGPKL